MDRKPHEIIPEFPRTPHVPGSEVLEEGDVVSTYQETAHLFLSPAVLVEEKVDGSNLGVALREDGHFLVRNRSRFIRKGETPKNPSGKQYLSVWNYLLDRRSRFEALEGLTVYGEWCRMAHGVLYDRLPDLFIAFDLYEPGKGFLPPVEARVRLDQAGFTTPTRVHQGRVVDFNQVLAWAWEPSTYCSDSTPREGVYLRDLERGDRFKMVRPGFVQGRYFGTDMVRNQVVRV